MRQCPRAVAPRDSRKRALPCFPRRGAAPSGPSTQPSVPLPWECWGGNSKQPSGRVTPRPRARPVSCGSGPSPSGDRAQVGAERTGTRTGRTASQAHPGASAAEYSGAPPSLRTGGAHVLQRGTRWSPGAEAARPAPVESMGTAEAAKPTPRRKEASLVLNAHVRVTGEPEWPRQCRWLLPSAAGGGQCGPLKVTDPRSVLAAAQEALLLRQAGPSRSAPSFQPPRPS